MRVIPLVLLVAMIIPGCDAPRSLSTAQMTPALLPISSTPDDPLTAVPDQERRPGTSP